MKYLLLLSLIGAAFADEMEDRRAAILKCFSENVCTNLSGQERDYVTRIRDIIAKNRELHKTWAKSHPEWKEDLSKPSHMNYLMYQNEELEKAKLKLADEFCRKNVKALCFSAEKKAKIQNEHDRYICRVKREHQFLTSTKKDKKEIKQQIVDGHNEQWDSLQDVASKCDYLLSKDREVLELSFSGLPDPKSGDLKIPLKISGRNIKAETCEWVTDISRRIVKASPADNCSVYEPQKLCIGYVSCQSKNSDARFVRLSTCSASNCGPTDSDAMNCTLEQGFYSRVPARAAAAPAQKTKHGSGAVRQ